MRLKALAALGLLAALWLSAAASRPAPAAVSASSSAVAVSPDGRLVAAVNPDSDSITIVDAASLKVLGEVAVGDDPRTLCFSPDSRVLAVANRGSSDVSLVGLPECKERRRVRTRAMPYGVITDGARLYVSEFATGSVAVFDARSGAPAGRVETAPYPAGLALSADRATLLVTHAFSGRLSRLDAATLEVRAVADAGDRANLSQFVAFSPDGRKAYLPQTLSNVDAVPATFDTTVIPVVSVVDLASMTALAREQVYLATLDRGANRPFAAAASADGRYLYVANAGSNDVTVADPASGRILAQVDVGAEPRGLALSPDGRRLYVNNTLDGTLSVVRAGAPRGGGPSAEYFIHKAVPVAFNETVTCRSCHAGAADSAPLGPDEKVELTKGQLWVVNRDWAVEATVTLTRIPLEPRLLRGKKLFNAAVPAEMSAERWISCASCHNDGLMDARTWPGSADGPRNTPLLAGVGETLPAHWSGDFDELQDVEGGIRSLLFGRGLSTGDVHEPLGEPYAGRSPELDALAEYIASLRAPVSPYAEGDAVARGRAVFEAAGCARCHAPPLYTDRKLYDVGTGDPAREKHRRGTTFDTPSLRGLWLTAPYLHDGSAPTLEDALSSGREHAGLSKSLTERERRDLVAFLRSL